ncbi:conserved hypothetical protein [Xanthomonas oryzae pv. oryzae KACC 10331]|uniref:DUF3616 domain-containing protein n=1 Tax=Xanthomonas oryzae pv. oryzae (strain KACC10331 / KXO85) TaxID=291331 RepID=Q05I22_XANOR|nr:DUF3616 domain-containing protein [Xanthomonas oryzae]ABJ89909.1 conserved hypothetical protein [Xanthomonas oryzae pv. oryzae KACC 10331]BAE68147.1 conserved hypothetical protein [Xanthomonas oryzae pv. oryzae MAFF 311018]
MAKKTLIPYSVRRELAPGALVHSNLSGAAFTDDWLWVAGDEACAVDRLRKLGPVQRQTLRFGEGQSFPLADLLDLSGEDGEEADLEGMGLSDGFLWVIGSHGSKGKNAEPGRDDAENAKRLTKLKLDGNRRLLACLPACRSNRRKTAARTWCVKPPTGAAHFASRAMPNTTSSPTCWPTIRISARS